jgi:isoleucyl-tRNA synthetase
VSEAPPDKPSLKHTLNLPQTEFAMQAKLANREPERLQRWQTEKLYERIQADTAGRPEFLLVDGPPYANGDIHIGHAVNKILKDIMVKSERLDGRHAAFVPGWDCHGLPIELQVEKKHGKVGDKLDAASFRAKCREYAAEQVARQRADFERLGVLADWDKPYLTMHPAFEAEQLRALADIVARGHVVRGFKPVHWCLDCGSSLAEAEVEYADKSSTAVDVRFAAADPAAVAAVFGVAAPEAVDFVIWTTTPWTLPANRALCVHPELDYAWVALGEGAPVIVAAELAAELAARAGTRAEVIATTAGGTLEGLKAEHPFAGREVPVICGEHVTLEAGTGIVHTAPGHGADDFVVGQRYGLETDNPVTGNGVFLDRTPLVGGEHVRKADKIIVEALRGSGRLLHSAPFEHSYPHCWRHKTPLIFRATPQWFVSMEAQGLRETALAAIRQTQWIPAWGQARIESMVAGRPDWCISRQRTWGVPMAVFIDRETQQLHPDTPALLARVAEAVERDGLEAWFGSKPADWGVDEDRYEASTDTLDVWFDSGVVHRCAGPATGSQPGDAIADLYLEGSDQHRGWFQSSLLTSAAMHGRAPYRAVLTHGFTVDEQGRKMSKSAGNVVPPQQVMKTLGADILRLWVASADYSGEIAISDNLLKRIADAYRRIRNTLRFVLGNLHDFDPARDALAPEAMLPGDAEALREAAALQSALQRAYAARELHSVYQRLHNYCVVDLGGRYLDVLKDRLYTTRADSRARRSAQTALWHIGEALVRWIAPILSFTAEEAWEALPGSREATVFAQSWWRFPEAPASTIDWVALRALRAAAKKQLEEARAAGTIKGDLDAELRLWTDSPALRAAMEALGEELRFWLLTSDAVLVEARELGMQAHALDGGGTLGVRVLRSEAEKCQRCWHRRADVGATPAHPGLCGRCVANVDGAGEHRRVI